jgi:hypothetical protein
MATVTIYYSRTDQDYDNYNLYLIPGNKNTSGQLFPSVEQSAYYSDYPRKKYSFTVTGDLGYVTIDTNTATNFAFYIKRKDFFSEYSGDLCDCSITANYECFYHKIAGDVWNVDSRFTSTLYVQPNSSYIYKDSTFTDIDMQAVKMISETDMIEAYVKPTQLKLYYNFENYNTINIPDEDNNYDTFIQEGIDYSDQLVLLYLEGKTYTIGENVNLSINTSALEAEKTDALQVIDKGIANSLYQLGEVIADFDEDAFLADVEGYKETKDISLEGTIDYLKARLDARALIS